MAKITRLLSSLEETALFGRELASKLSPTATVAFYGPLGAGKTTLIKEIVSFFGIDKDMVTSPTFTYLHIYGETIFHFDLYRIKNSKIFADLGFEEYFGKGIALIEWAERIEDILPPSTIKIFLSHKGESLREACFI